MTAAIIGISLGLLVIVIFIVLNQFDKKLMYALVLSGIGFLYVGFVWMDRQAFIINAIQAIVFVFIAYYGVKKHLKILAAGYVLHAIWDTVYHTFQDPGLIPPQYNLFCLSIDLTIGIYLFILGRTVNKPGQILPANKL